MTGKNFKEFLDEKSEYYEQRFFIESDPVSIPHLFSRKEDIEIAGFLTATISWGQRKTIITNSRKLMSMMGDEPFRFVTEASAKDLKKLHSFKHRTFNGDDLVFFINRLSCIYKNKGGLENIFVNDLKSAEAGIIHSRKIFLENYTNHRAKKHFADIENGSAAKRLAMFLRWMVRKGPVDFGIWKSIRKDRLVCPLDIHAGNVARKLGILNRKANDWKSVLELTSKLSEFDKNDPVKYDYALFGLGLFEKF